MTRYFTLYPTTMDQPSARSPCCSPVDSPCDSSYTCSSSAVSSSAGAQSRGPRGVMSCESDSISVQLRPLSEAARIQPQALLGGSVTHAAPAGRPGIKAPGGAARQLFAVNRPALQAWLTQAERIQVRPSPPPVGIARPGGLGAALGAGLGACRAAQGTGNVIGEYAVASCLTGVQGPAPRRAGAAPGAGRACGPRPGPGGRPGRLCAPPRDP